MLTSHYKLSVLYTEGLGSGDAADIINLTKKHIQFSDYSFTKIEFPPQFRKFVSYLKPPHVVHCESKGDGLLSYFESQRKENELISILTENPITQMELGLEGGMYPSFSLGYAGPNKLWFDTIEPGGVAVSSTAGMGEKCKERTAGTLLYGLGSLFLLEGSCKNEKCFMGGLPAKPLFDVSRFTHFYPHLDKEKGFCEDCKQKLNIMIRKREKKQIFYQQEIKQIMQGLMVPTK